MALPPVGATIQLVGAAAFNAAAKGVVASFDAMNKAAEVSAKGIQSSFGAVSKSLSSTTGLMIAGAAATETAIIGLASASAVMGAKFVQNITNAGVAVDATTKDMEEMGNEVIDLSRKWNINSQQLSKSIGSYMRAGGSVDDLKKGVYEYIVALTTASGGELTLEQAILLVTGAQGAYNLRGRESERIINAITSAANASAISYKDIYRTLPQMSAAYAALGYSVEDALTVTALLGQEYLRNSDAGTAMKQMIISLMNPSKAAREAMREYGISLYDAQGNVLPLVNVVNQLNKAFGDVDDTLDDSTIMNMKKGQALAQIFGADALRPAIILAKRGANAYLEFRNQIAATSAINMAEKMIKPSESQLGILINQFTAFATVIGQQVEPAFRDLITDANTFLGTITSAQISMIGKAFSSMITGVGFDKLSEEASKVFSGDVLRAFDAFVRLLYTVRDTVINQIVPSFVYLMNSITGNTNAAYSLATVFDSISSSIQVFANIITVINVALGDLISWLKQTTIGAIALDIIFKGILALPFVTLIAAFVAIAGAIGSLLGPVLLISLAVGAVIYAFENWDKIVEIVNSIVAPIVSTFNEIVDSIVSIITPIIDTVTNVFRSIYSAIVPIIGTLVKFISDNFEYIAAFIAAIMLDMAIKVIAYMVMVAIQIGMTIVPAIVAAASAISSSVAGIILRFAAMATAAIASAVATAAAFVVGLVPAVVGAIGAIIAALGTILIPLVILGAAAAALYLAWKTNFLGIQDFVGKILTWISDKIASFINWLKSLPVIGEFVTGVASSINLVGDTIGTTFDGAKNTVTDFVGDAKKAFDKYTGSLDGSLPKMDDFQKRIDEINKSNRDATEATNLATDAQNRWNEAQGKGTLGGVKPAQPGFLPEDDKKLSKADKLKQIVKDILIALKDLPIMTKDLAEFLGKIAEDTPERLAPMLSALLASKKVLQEIANIKKQILDIDLQTVFIESKQVVIRAQIAAIEAKENFLRSRYAQQILTINTSIAQLDLQIIPLRQKISDIDREITLLQRDNLNLVRQRAEAEIALLPFKKQLLEIDQKIQELEWKNYDNLIAQAEGELSILPAKQRIAQIERQISDVVNKRVELQQKENQILAERQLTLLDRELKKTNKELDAAWQKMDVPKILGLEDQIRALEDQKSAAEDYSDLIAAQAEDTKFANDMATIRLENEKLGYEELIKPTEDYIFNLQQQIDLQQAITDLNKLRLEAERQAIEQLMQPYKNVIDNLNYEIEAEKTRNSLRVIDLQIEKQALEDMLAPLEAQRQAYQNQIDIINAQITVSIYSYEVQKTNLQGLEAEQEVYRTGLLATKAQLEETYSALIQQYVLSLAQSRAFTVEESYEVAKRLGIWTDQVGKLQEIFTQFSNIKSEADEVTKSINAIPKDVTIVITTVHKDEYQTTGKQSFAEGGFVKGPLGAPVSIIAHAGEYIVPIRSITPTIVNMAQQRLSPVQAGNSYTTNYNVDANYGMTQSPASIKMDLQALALKTRR